MQVSKEFLMEAFGLSLLVALIFISMQMFQRATRLAGLLEEGQEQQIAHLEEYEIVKYDGMRLDGMTVVSYIKNITGNYMIPVQVTTETATFTVSSQSEYAGLRKVGAATYISPLAFYLCTVIRNENGAITGITIIVENGGN